MYLNTIYVEQTSLKMNSEETEDRAQMAIDQYGCQSPIGQQPNSYGHHYW